LALTNTPPYLSLPSIKVGNGGGIHLSMNYLVLNETKQNE